MTALNRSGASSSLKAKCPTCGANVPYNEKNPFRPFCSDACRNQDLAAWASDAYQVPGESIDPSDETSRSGDSDEQNNF